MGSEEAKDSLKGVDWKTVGGSMGNEPNVGPVTKKRFSKKMRQVPDYYFLPRRSIPSAIAIYGSIVATGVGAGMLGSIRKSKRMEVSFGSSTNELTGGY